MRCPLHRHLGHDGLQRQRWSVQPDTGSAPGIVGPLRAPVRGMRRRQRAQLVRRLHQQPGQHILLCAQSHLGQKMLRRKQIHGNIECNIIH